MHVLVEIKLLVIIGMNSHKKRRPALHSLDDGVYDTCLQVVAGGEHKVEASVMAQILDMLFGVINVVEAAWVVGVDDALDFCCGQTCGLCMGMLVCWCSKRCHGDGKTWGWDDLRLM